MDFERALLLMQVVHASVNIDAARPIMQAAMEELKAIATPAPEPVAEPELPLNAPRAIPTERRI